MSRCSVLTGPDQAEKPGQSGGGLDAYLGRPREWIPTPGLVEQATRMTEKFNRFAESTVPGSPYDQDMEWITLVGTLSGGILGVSSALLVDWTRAKRERGHKFDEVRRNVYTAYLVALTETEGALQILALNQPTPIDRAAVMSVFRSKSLLAHRYQAALVAPPEVAHAAEGAYQKLRNIREAIVTTNLTVGTPKWATNGSTEWQAVHQPYWEAIEGLRAAMRDDIQGGERRLP